MQENGARARTRTQNTGNVSLDIVSFDALKKIRILSLLIMPAFAWKILNWQIN